MTDWASTIYVFFGIDDMEAAIERVRELGGTVEDLPEGRGHR